MGNKKHKKTNTNNAVTKRSRAARRGEINLDDPQMKSLEQIPRAENTNVANSIIRTTARNEDLLNLKLKKNKKPTAVSKVTKEKKSKFDKVDGRLSTRIERSLEKSRVVKNQRKMGWETVNQKIRERLQNQVTEEAATEKAAEELNITDFLEPEDKTAIKNKTPQNAFELLDEVEA